MEPGGSTEVLPLDLGNLESVQGFADDFTRRHDRLDVLVNNAGPPSAAVRWTSTAC